MTSTISPDAAACAPASRRISAFALDSADKTEVSCCFSACNDQPTFIVGFDARPQVAFEPSVCVQGIDGASTQPGSPSADCGGRTPKYDAVDVFRSLLVLGITAGVDDGIERDDHVHSTTEFPFLAAP